MGRHAALVWTIVLAAQLSVAGTLSAQVVPDTVRIDPDSVAAADSAALAADTVPVDSARLAIFDRLNRLNRLPGEDSILYIQDSTRLAQAAEGNRGGVGMDTIAAALMRMPGFQLIEYDGERADFGAQDRLLVLTASEQGRARVVQEGSIFEADSTITFDEPAGIVTGTGMTTFTPPDAEPVNAARTIYSLQQQRASAYGAQTNWNAQGADWRIVDGNIHSATPDSSFIAQAHFTSCDIDEPHYHFETGEIKIVNGNVLVARDVTLYFADVPVAWLPFMAQSLSRGRSSGLLTPRFSVNDIVRTSGGYRRRVSNVGFYWAASEYFDALTSFDWFSETFFNLTGSLRYNVRRQFLEGNVAVRHYWNADGSTEFAVDTRHSWEIDERTRLQVSGRFVSSNDFVRENSFNPQEVTQSIDSDAGLNRRFDWGSLSLSASRKKFLSDDRTDWLLPSANLSLSPITLFSAPSSEAAFYNNMTWSGSAAFTRNAFQRVTPDTIRSITGLDEETRSSRARSNLSIGSLTFSQSVDLREDLTLGVPEALLLLGDSADASGLVTGAPTRDVADATLGWNVGLGYQQQLIGSTTLTPRLAMSGSMFRSDQDSLAQNFVAAPSRVSFGAQLKTDIYGFFGGFGPFEAIRHKISPAFDYNWSPESTPSQLQRDVFGARALQPRNTLSISLTQTFEAKRRTDEEGGGVPIEAPPEIGPDGLPIIPPDSVPDDPFAQATQRSDQGPDAGPQRMQTTPSVTLLAWRMSVIDYDFVQADSVGLFLAGFETLRLSNQFSSDYLRGLSISMDHELFEDVENEDQRLVERSFKPHLASMNLGFSFGSSSGLFQWLFGGGGGDDETPATEPDDSQPLDFAGVNDESSIVPVSGQPPVNQPQPRAAGSAGTWNASLSYSLQRPRTPDATRLLSQMLSGTVRLEPTENWSVSWRTAYDLEAQAFNDHSIRLTRDLHRWQANFDFLQTATGNWTFRFEVSLLDNRDLKFDYKQRNLDLGLPASQR